MEENLISKSSLLKILRFRKREMNWVQRKQEAVQKLERRTGRLKI